MRETIETTYADLRPDDLVIDKTGNAWAVAEVQTNGNVEVFGVTFWLLAKGSNVKTHYMTRAGADKVTVSRIPKQADEAAKLESDFPINELGDTLADVPEPRRSEIEAEIMDEAVANVKAIGGTVEAEVTAEEIDAANASTEEKPEHLPPFESMTILEMRSHLYLLHGVYAHDMKSRDETIAMHARATAEHAAGRLQTPAHIPHTHDGEALK